MLNNSMPVILHALRDHPVRAVAAGDLLLRQGEQTGLLYVLIEGEVEVTKDGVRVARVSEPGAIFGDLSVLLGGAHTADVCALTACQFYVVEEARAFLEANPGVCLTLCELLARRLDSVNKYLVDVKRQFAGSDHLAMVDGVLDTLLHRQPRARVTPKPSTLRDPELPD